MSPLGAGAHKPILVFVVGPGAPLTASVAHQPKAGTEVSRVEPVPPRAPRGMEIHRTVATNLRCLASVTQSTSLARAPLDTIGLAGRLVVGARRASFPRNMSLMHDALLVAGTSS